MGAEEDTPCSSQCPSRSDSTTTTHDVYDNDDNDDDDEVMPVKKKARKTPEIPVTSVGKKKGKSSSQMKDFCLPLLNCRIGCNYDNKSMSVSSKRRVWNSKRDWNKRDVRWSRIA